MRNVATDGIAFEVDLNVKEFTLHKRIRTFYIWNTKKNELNPLLEFHSHIDWH